MSPFSQIARRALRIRLCSSRCLSPPAARIQSSGWGTPNPSWITITEGRKEKPGSQSSAQDEARRQLEAEVETRVEAAPGKRGGVAGTKRSSTWDFVRILHEGKREDNKKVITVKCTIKTESGKECDWERKLVDGETGAMSKHFRSKGTDSVTCKACVNHKAAADICDESSCNGTGEVCAPEE